MTKNVPYINISGLSIGYKTSKKANIVAQGLNGMAHKGELIGLLGANGTGKSTLLKTLCGFQPYFSGQVEIMGQCIGKMSEKEISYKLSVVLTEKVTLPNATVYELVAYGRSPYTRMLGRLDKEDQHIIDQAMEQCGIAYKRNSLLSAISDGEKQKAFIAKALAQDTPIIVLDEPTAFLDLPARVEIIQLLREVAIQSGKTIILSTHDLDLALQMADKLWLLPKGGPLIEGTPEDLVLQNAIQELFAGKGLVFDVKTGQFKINYKHTFEIAVKGQGFEYFLIRRAFARNGVKVVPFEHGVKCWIEITDIGRPTFIVLYKNNAFYKATTISDLVQFTLEYLCTQTENTSEEQLKKSEKNNISCR